MAAPTQEQKKKEPVKVNGHCYAPGTSTRVIGNMQKEIETALRLLNRFVLDPLEKKGSAEISSTQRDQALKAMRRVAEYFDLHGWSVKHAASDIKHGHIILDAIKAIDKGAFRADRGVADKPGEQESRAVRRAYQLLLGELASKPKDLPDRLHEGIVIADKVKLCRALSSVLGKVESKQWLKLTEAERATLAALVSAAGEHYLQSVFGDGKALDNIKKLLVPGVQFSIERGKVDDEREKNTGQMRRLYQAILKGLPAEKQRHLPAHSWTDAQKQVLRNKDLQAAAKSAGAILGALDATGFMIPSANDIRLLTKLVTNLKAHTGWPRSFYRICSNLLHLLNANCKFEIDRGNARELNERRTRALRTFFNEIAGAAKLPTRPPPRLP